MKNKTIYIITGGVASGKSTLSYNFIKYFNLYDLPFVSTDNYYNVFFSNQLNFEKFYNMARCFTDLKLEEYVNNGQSFIWETVLSKDKKRNFIKKCKELGYSIVCMFVGIDNIQTAINRSMVRFKEGDHFVEEEFIKDRFTKSLESLKWVSSIADVLCVFDNTKKLKLLYYKSTNEKYIYQGLPDWVLKNI